MFSELPRGTNNDLRSDRFLVILDDKSPVLPPKLHAVGPVCVWIDQMNIVTGGTLTFALDAAPLRSSRL